MKNLEGHLVGMLGSGERGGDEMWAWAKDLNIDVRKSLLFSDSPCVSLKDGPGFFSSISTIGTGRYITSSREQSRKGETKIPLTKNRRMLRLRLYLWSSGWAWSCLSKLRVGSHSAQYRRWLWLIAATHSFSQLLISKSWILGFLSLLHLLPLRSLFTLDFSFYSIQLLP